MLFNSYEFIFAFLPITILAFYSLSKCKQLKLAKVSLVIASLVFYAYWDRNLLPLITASVIANYLFGYTLEKFRSKRLLAIYVGLNLSLLLYYKYTSFALHTYNQIAHTAITIPNIILPLGISFFTFTQIAYLVDTYRGETKHYSFLNYLLFVTFFPHLIAGPILYHRDIIPQFNKIKNYIFSPENFTLGIVLFSIGLFKKVFIADSLGPWVNLVFSNSAAATFFEAWAGALAYTLQLYFDFSGYSEMALGLGLMLNIKLPINFNSPYLSTSIIDFWRRWHITLSTFLKNYLYIPLGGNRNGETKKMRNVLLTMILGGLWHGAGWTFIIWGTLHGIFLVINHQWRRVDFYLPNVICWFLTFLCVTFAWVFFRANNLQDALVLTKVMLGFKGIVFPEYFSKFAVMQHYGVVISNFIVLQVGKKELFVLLIFSGFLISLGSIPTRVSRFKPTLIYAIMISIILVISIFKINTGTSEFLYFQF